MNLAAGNGTRALFLKKKEQTESWEMIDEQTSENLGMLNAEAAGHLVLLLKALAKNVHKTGA